MGLVFAMAVLGGCAAPPPEYRIVDDIDLPFVDDPEVIGTWTAVDMVETVGQFVPGQKQWAGDLILQQMTFSKGGILSVANWTWTKGVIINPNDQTASQYQVQAIQGEVYLFFQWKTGDYSIRGETPWFYVMRKA
jgi:bla regulator protein BlaR1